MKNSKRIACLLLTLFVSGYLTIRWEAQLSHSLEEACYHSRLALAGGVKSEEASQTGVASAQDQLQSIHLCHSCLICNPRISVAFEAAKEWNAFLVPERSLELFRSPPSVSRQVDCPNRRAPPAILL